MSFLSHFCFKIKPLKDLQPNIVYILADDLGWSDVSWNNRNIDTTPFLKSLRKRGTILTQSYSSHRCTPSRAQFLTGRYAFRHGLNEKTFFFEKIRKNFSKFLMKKFDPYLRYGLGSDPISKDNPVGLDPSQKLLPSYLKDVGYETHAVGKWHLGFCNSSYQ